MRWHRLSITLLIASALMTTVCAGSARADVVINVPPPPPQRAAAETPNTYVEKDAAPAADVGTIALVRYGRYRGTPRDTYGPSFGSWRGWNWNASWNRVWGRGWGNAYYYAPPYYGAYYCSPFIARRYVGPGSHPGIRQVRVIGFY